MKKHILFAVAMSVLAVTIHITSPKAFAEEIPMWEGINKSDAQIKADKKLVNAAIKLTNGNIDKAAHRGVVLGWKEIEKGNADQAIKRFNQAWLINPKRGDIYWGFAIATSIRGDNLQTVDKWFTKAEAIIGPDPRLHSDWGRVLQQRKQPKLAIAHFLKSIKANPKNPEAHIGMIHAARDLGDKTTAAKHLHIYKQLTQ